MNTSTTRALFLALTFTLTLATHPSTSLAQVTEPFSALTTSRESKKITNIAVTPPYTRTYQNLASDSKDLTFQDVTDGRIFLAFASKDGTVDDYDLSGYNNNRCSTVSDRYQVYWADKTAQLPAVCVSYNREAGQQGDGNSQNPRLGGPSEDEGRYVAFETLATNLSLPVVLPTPTYQQIMVHDRKFEYSWLSAGKCDAIPNGSSYLWGMSDDGRKLLLTSGAGNIIDNLSPVCTDGSPYNDVYIRDGGNCNVGRGQCYTSVLHDYYGYHAGANTVELLDAHAQNAHSNADLSATVFDTTATVPVHFNPDVRGYRDIYLAKSNNFYRISEAQIPHCDVLGELQPLKNTDGPANGDSVRPRIDGTGRYIVFESEASDLVVDEIDDTDDTNDDDELTCTAGFPHPQTFSYVDTHGHSQIYIYDAVTKKVELISKSYQSGSDGKEHDIEGANDDSTNAWISRDGHFVVFESRATDLMSGSIAAADVSNGNSRARNIYMYDRVMEKVYLVTTGTQSSSSPRGLTHDATITHVSTNGLIVAFQTIAQNVTGTNLPDSSIQHVYLAQNACPLDTDGDTYPDCLDQCEQDANKSAEGQCGCGVADTDTDADLIADCVDACPSDANKTAAGQCGCNVEDTDSDGDGVADCIDVCDQDPIKDDSEGACGCGVAETDTDSDGVKDCVDDCDTNPAKSDDSQCSCSELKDVPGVCGCNIADVDDNDNGAPDCQDPTAATVPAKPKIYVTKVPKRGGGFTNQVSVRLQAFSGTVRYTATLKGATGFETKRGTRRYFTFSNVSRGRKTLTYSVSVGKGSSLVTSKKRTLAFIVK
jgi:hypothetical protein